LCSNDYVETIHFESPSAVRHFGEMAFKLCTSLTDICVPASVEMIHPKCFKGCSSLSSVVFEVGSQLIAIANLAFASCHSLQTITLPGSVIIIGKDCFTDCRALRQILFESPSQLYEIGDFGDCSVDWIDIPDSVQSVGSLPFARPNSCCVVMFGNASRLSAISVGMITIGGSKSSWTNFFSVNIAYRVPIF
jgi:hypothetical protein